MTEGEQTFFGYNGILHADAIKERMRELQARKRENDELQAKIERDIAELRELLGRIRDAVE